MSDAIISAAFETRLKAWAAARTPPLPVSYENQSFTTPADGKYLVAWLLPTRTGNEMLADAHRVFEGIFQVNVVRPRDEGAVIARQIKDEIDALYPSAFVYGGITINMTAPMGAVTGIPADGTYTLPVSGKYRVDTI
jgi:hypothetical protein